MRKGIRRNRKKKILRSIALSYKLRSLRHSLRETSKNIHLLFNNVSIGLSFPDYDSVQRLDLVTYLPIAYVGYFILLVKLQAGLPYNINENTKQQKKREA